MAGQLRVVMAQLNLLVGDISGNTDLLLSAARQAISEQKADLVVFPELALTGYPPEDLLFRPSMKIRVDRALSIIKAANLPIHMIIGYPLHEDGKLFNALSVFHGTQVVATYRKQTLPNYQVFDERRYFVPGNQPCVLEIKGIPVGMTICEDMWDVEPTRQAKAAGAALLININASPYHLHKMTQRLALLKERASAHALPIIYVNMVGGQDELVFDGGSMAVDEQGDCQVLGPSFSTQLIPVTVTQKTANKVQVEPGTVCEQASLETTVYNALVLGLHDYVCKNGFKSVVLGLSGGIDSALTLAIAADALGKERVQAVMMPFTYTSQMSRDLAQTQAQQMGVKYSVIPIVEPYESFTVALADEFANLPTDVTEQNIQARCRGVILMAISNKKGALVLTTGNKSEIAVGYSTLYGDMAGGFDVLKDVAKTMVYRLAEYRNSQSDARDQPIIPQQVIDRAPTAELAPGQIDQDSLPAYEQLDEILALYVEQDLSAQDIIAKGFSADTVRRVLRLVDINEYKRRQSPLGVRLTQRGFGRDRRYPITSGWQLGD